MANAQPGSNDELLAVFVLNPLWWFAAAGPGLARGGVAVFGGHLGASTGTARTASGKDILCGQAKLRDQRTNLRNRFGELIAPGFVDSRCFRSSL